MKPWAKNTLKVIAALACFEILCAIALVVYPAAISWILAIMIIPLFLSFFTGLMVFAYWGAFRAPEEKAREAINPDKPSVKLKYYKTIVLSILFVGALYEFSRSVTLLIFVAPSHRHWPDVLNAIWSLIVGGSLIHLSFQFKRSTRI